MYTVYSNQQEEIELTAYDLAREYAIRQHETKFYVIQRTSGRVLGEADSMSEAMMLEKNLAQQEKMYGFGSLLLGIRPELKSLAKAGLGKLGRRRIVKTNIVLANTWAAGRKYGPPALAGAVLGALSVRKKKS